MQRSFTNPLGTIVKYLKAAIFFVPHYFKKYEVIHLHYFYPLIILVWFYKIFYPKTKLIVTFHGSDINTQISSSNKSFFKYLSAKIDFTIPVGKEVAKNVVQKLHLPIGKILPVGIDQDKFYKIPNLNKDFDFIFVGSFFEVKGVDILVEVIKKLPKNISFCIVGKGEKYETIFRELISNGYLITLRVDQSQNELRVLYNKSRFLFMPSRSEGFPTVTIEAMFCGVPVVTSKIPQFEEQVKQGENGFMLDTGSISILSQDLIRINNILNEEYNKLSANALNSFKELSLAQVCKELLKIYRQ